MTRPGADNVRPRATCEVGNDSNSVRYLRSLGTPMAVAIAGAAVSPLLYFTWCAAPQRSSGLSPLARDIAAAVQVHPPVLQALRRPDV